MGKCQAFYGAEFPHLHQDSRYKRNTAMALNSFKNPGFPAISYQSLDFLTGLEVVKTKDKATLKAPEAHTSIQYPFQ